MNKFWTGVTSTLSAMVLLFILVGDFVSIRQPSSSSAQIAQATPSYNPSLPTSWSSSSVVNTDNTGLYVYTFPAACKDGSNIPIFNAVPQGPNPQAGVSVNVQAEGVPTSTSVSFRVTKNTATTVALIGLTVAVTAAGTGVGVTGLNISCIKQ